MMMMIQQHHNPPSTSYLSPITLQIAILQDIALTLNKGMPRLSPLRRECTKQEQNLHL